MISANTAVMNKQTGRSRYGAGGVTVIGTFCSLRFAREQDRINQSFGEDHEMVKSVNPPVAAEPL
jgi:hypothetical protein